MFPTWSRKRNMFSATIKSACPANSIHQVIKAPITQAIRSFKKQWDDLLDNVPSVQRQRAFA
ncbi:hypothetical protein [Parageobacillus thermantarcticus]|uniref:hypothetical protein n=1 Tax=Parageobacillus thermantarcticus TaxID=186116 RepID=UPI003CC5DF03